MLDHFSALVDSSFLVLAACVVCAHPLPDRLAFIIALSSFGYRGSRYPCSHTFTDNATSAYPQRTEYF